MKKLTLIVYFCFLLSAQAAITERQVDKLADIIFKIENSKRYPYGIKSVNTNGNADYARKICKNTIRNNYVRWENAGKPDSYFNFLANRFCPKKDDPIGNTNWKKNVKVHAEKNGLVIK